MILLDTHIWYWWINLEHERFFPSLPSSSLVTLWPCKLPLAEMDTPSWSLPSLCITKQELRNEKKIVVCMSVFTSEHE